MTAISTAVGSERLSRTTGYKIDKLFPSLSQDELHAVAKHFDAVLVQKK